MVELGLRLKGVDSSPTMISFCRERLPDHEWIVADMPGSNAETGLRTKEKTDLCADTARAL
jgi:trans-aconitate methyltransferase